MSGGIWAFLGICPHCRWENYVSFHDRPLSQWPLLLTALSDLRGSSAFFQAWQGSWLCLAAVEMWVQLSMGARQLPVDLASGFASLPTVFSLHCRFLDEVQSHSDVNKMSVQNLATVFGPNILRPQIEDPVTIMEGNGGGVRGALGSP